MVTFSLIREDARRYASFCVGFAYLTFMVTFLDFGNLMEHTSQECQVKSHQDLQSCQPKNETQRHRHRAAIRDLILLILGLTPFSSRSSSAFELWTKAIVVVVQFVWTVSSIWAESAFYSNWRRRRRLVFPLPPSTASRKTCWTKMGHARARPLSLISAGSVMLSALCTKN